MVENLAPSKIIEINGMIKAMEHAGKEIFSLCVGEPDYYPPEAVIQATCEAAKTGKTKYTAVAGEQNLREAIARDLTHRKETPYTADQIVVANGAKQCVLQALLTVVSPGDSVLVPAPYWASYPDMVQLCHATPVIVHTEAHTGFTLTPEILRQSLEENPKTSAIILCNPSNPSGRNADRTNLRALAEVLFEYPQVAVISDEIYERLVYDGQSHYSFANIAPEMFDRIITINGQSKSHAMTGYRVGFTASCTALAKQIAKLQSQMTSCASAIAQAAALAALEDPSIAETHWLEDRLEQLTNKRNLAMKLLNDIPKVSCITPTGAFYLMPDISAYFGKRFVDPITHEVTIIKDSSDICVLLLKNYCVGMVPGEAFGCPNCVRLSYAASMRTIEEALTRLRSFILSLQ
jgi:aspartate/methionine/tyrosine aminotransferase